MAMPVESQKATRHIKHHFLPHPERKCRASLLASRVIILYSLLALFTLSFLKTVPGHIPGILGYASNINIQDLLEKTYQKRQEMSVPELAINPQLTSAAEKKAKHMFEYNYWAHIAPNGTDPWSFILGEKYDYLYAGENLAKNFTNSEDVVEAWYKSPSHRENLINGKYTEVGFATVNGVLDGYETTLVVQLFGRSRTAPQQIAVRGENTTTKSPVPVSKPKYTSVEPKLAIFPYVKTAVLSFAVFILILFLLDVWYSKRHAILKYTGHSLAHVIFISFAIIAMYISLTPGRII